jgi:hypothetical protein
VAPAAAACGPISGALAFSDTPSGFRTRAWSGSGSRNQPGRRAPRRLPHPEPTGLAKAECNGLNRSAYRCGLGRSNEVDGPPLLLFQLRWDNHVVFFPVRKRGRLPLRAPRPPAARPARRGPTRPPGPGAPAGARLGLLGPPARAARSGPDARRTWPTARTGPELTCPGRPQPTRSPPARAPTPRPGRPPIQEHRIGPTRSAERTRVRSWTASSDVSSSVITGFACSGSTAANTGLR